MSNCKNYKDKNVFECGPYSLSKESLRIVYMGPDEQDDGEYHWFTLAMFTRGKEGYELKFCGSRPFDYSWAPECTFMEFAKVCQRYVDALYEIEQLTGK
jgi:hypothetical protein